MHDNLSDIRKRFNALQSKGELNEENTKNKVIVPLLYLLGYKEEWFSYEPPIVDNKNRADIMITTDNRDATPLIIEAKAGTKELTDADLKQLTVDYLAKIGYEWGILSNGQEFWLINRTIKGTYKEKVILKFDIFNAEDFDIVKYFSYEYLYDREVTRYFKYLKEFEIHRKMKEDFSKRSWEQYYFTIYNFFEFLARKGRYCNIETLRIQDFQEYILYEIESKKRENKRYAMTKTTIINKYRWLKGMFSYFKDDGQISKNPFDCSVNDALKGISYIDDEPQNQEPITVEELDMFFQKLGETYKNERNLIIAYLCIYAGLDREEIRNLKIEHFDFKKKVLSIHSREIPLPDKLIIQIKEYIEQRKFDRAKNVDYLFYSTYGKTDESYFGPLDPSTFNFIIGKNLKKIEVKKERKKVLNQKFIKYSLIKNMFEESYHIEEISYLTGLSLSQIGKYITIEEIENKINISRMRNKHPYKKYFVD